MTHGNEPRDRVDRDGVGAPLFPSLLFPVGCIDREAC